MHLVHLLLASAALLKSAALAELAAMSNPNANPEYLGLAQTTANGTARAARAVIPKPTPTTANPPYLFGSLSLNASCTPENTRERPEVHDMDPAALDLYLQAVVQCQRTRVNASDPDSMSVYEQFAYQHHLHGMQNHGGSKFLPFHRVILLDYENMLRSCGPDPSLVVPYFNWTILGAAPWNDPVLSPRWFGDGARRERCGEWGCCVSDDAAYLNASTMRISPAWRSMNADGDACLKRNYTYGAAAGQSGLYIWYSVASLLLHEARFAVFAARWEMWHAALHMWIRGTMATMASPFDPLFMLHHAFVDHVWHQWQLLHDPAGVNYGGRNADGSEASLDNLLPPYPAVAVRDAMNVTRLCVVYRPTRLLNLINPQQVLPDAIPTSVPRPPRLSDEWIANNNLDASAVNESQAQADSHLDALNQVLGEIAAGGGPLTLHGVAVGGAFSHGVSLLVTFSSVALVLCWGLLI